MRQLMINWLCAKPASCLIDTGLIQPRLRSSTRLSAAHLLAFWSILNLLFMLAEWNSDCPALMLAFLTFVTLFYASGLDLHAPLYPVTEPGQECDNNQVNERDHGPDFEPFHVTRNDDFPGLGQFQDTDNRQNRGVF